MNICATYRQMLTVHSIVENTGREGGVGLSGRRRIERDEGKQSKQALRQSLGTRPASDRHESPFHSTDRPTNFLVFGGELRGAWCQTSQLVYRDGLPPVFTGNWRWHRSPGGVEERRALRGRRGRVRIRVQDVGNGSSDVRLISKSNLFNASSRREEPVIILRDSALCVR